jgi:hypothetical protein
METHPAADFDTATDATADIAPAYLVVAIVTIQAVTAASREHVTNVKAVPRQV